LPEILTDSRPDFVGDEVEIAMALEDDILQLLGTSSLKASDIAARLKSTRQEVNAKLFGALKGRVTQDKSYRWSAQKSRTDINSESVTAKNKRASLFQYYVDCLSADAGAGVSVFAAGQHDLDYVQLRDWPMQHAGEPADWRNAAVDKLLARQRREARVKTLWLGWPTLIRRDKSRKSNWEGNFVEPLLLWPIELDGEHPQIGHDIMFNGKALERLVGTDSATEEASLLSEELGLDDTDDIDFSDLADRLYGLRPDWPWIEQPDPEMVGDGQLLSEADIRPGFYNAPVIVLAERQPFTVGLERELLDLQSVCEPELDASALGVLLGAPRAEPTPFTKPILETAPLNAEQREAVRSALSRPFTVITGPPGTGKSQVVTAIIVNAAYHGLNVLFASKNNQAVGVVEQRVNGLTTRPVLLRLGGKSVQGTLADKLTTILSARVDPTQREGIRNANDKVSSAASALLQIDKQLEENRMLWNRAAALAKRVEPERLRLGDARFAAMETLDIDGLNALLVPFCQAVKAADLSHQGIFTKLFWPLVKGKREERLIGAFAVTQPQLVKIGIESNEPQLAFHQLAAALEQAAEVQSYHRLRNEIATGGDASSLVKRQVSVQRQLSAVSVAAFEGWLAALGERLTPDERKMLGDYTALLRTIAAANEGGSQVAKAIWANYYKLAAKAAKVFPGWAVTSLSARGRVPFASGHFDLVVIDEASQCDIASVLPLLYRAKRAVIIGDPEQLSHISRLSDQQEQSLMVRHGILDSPGAGWGYKATSIYALAASRVQAESIVALRDHHRSHSAIIQFSNQVFYGGNLRVATDYTRLVRSAGDVIRWVDVTGDVSRPRDGGAVNDKEATAVVAELRRLVMEQNYKGSIGVVTPFRAQGRRIRELVAQDGTLQTALTSQDFLAETVDKYQGDERDMMLFSPVISRGMPDSGRRFLARSGKLFNVAITRARAALIVVGDHAACAKSGVDYLEKFVEYLASMESEQASLEPEASGSIDYPVIAQPELVSDWERQFYSALAERGIFTIPQYPIDQYLLDLALVTKDGRHLDIEVDGEKYHRDPWTGEQVRRDQLRDMRLMEMGWDVQRFWVAEIRDNLEGCVDRVNKWLDS
jgi:very-short-patch-repair endonuclease